MLYVKNMVFLDGAIARLAPDLDILAEIANISTHFALAHGERLGRELGIDHTQVDDRPRRREGQLRRRRLDAAHDLPRPPERRKLINKRMREHARSADAHGGPDAPRDRPLHRRLRRPPGRAPAGGRAAADGEGRRLRRRPRRRRRLQAAQLDERAEHPPGGARPVGGDERRRRAAGDRAARGAERLVVGARTRSRPAEGRRGSPPAGAAGRGAARARRRPPLVRREYPTALGPVDLLLPGRRRAAPSRSRSSAGARSTAWSSSRGTSSA